MAGVRAMLAAERKRGQASIGIGANLATAYQNYSVASYQWNASWFAAFVDQAAAAGVVELSVFPAGMTDLSTAGVDAFFLDSLRRFLAHKTPEASAGARHAKADDEAMPQLRGLEHRPIYHLIPQGAEAGWISDPNGPIYYKGRYHVFYREYSSTTVGLGCDRCRDSDCWTVAANRGSDDGPDASPLQAGRVQLPYSGSGVLGPHVEHRPHPL